MIKISRLLIIPLIITLFIISGCGRREDKKVVATAGNSTLINSDLDYILPAGFREEMSEAVFRFVEDWAKEEILAQAAEDIGLQKNPEIAFRLEEARRNILASAYERELIASRVNVDSAKIYDYYLDNLDYFFRDRDEVRCSHIMISDSTEALIVDSLLFSLEFEEVALQFSHDPYNVDIGYFAREEMHPELAKVAFRLAVGERSGPIKTEFGYHFIKLLDYASKGSLREFADVRETLEDILIEREYNNAYRAVVDSLIAEKTIEVDSASVLKKVKK